MKKNIKYSVVTVFVFAFFGLSVCSAAKTGKIAKIFSEDMLSVDLAYFEQIAGIAKYTRGNTKIYYVDNCEVTATVVNGSVTALGLELSSKCTFDLNKFSINTNGKLPMPHNMTLGQFSTLILGDLSFTGQYLRCGSCPDPIIYALRIGSHADNWLDILLEMTSNAENQEEATTSWIRAMSGNDGYMNIESDANGIFNCDSKYSALANKLFRYVKISKITIGNNIGTLCEPLSNEGR